jgi:DNA adenine methylase
MSAVPMPLPEASCATSGFKPFLRWAGGKTRLLRFLRPHFPAPFESYYEPFVGGGAVFFDAGYRATSRAVLADLNPELVNTWLCVRDQPLSLLEALDEYTGLDAEADYYGVRDSKQQPTGSVERAARFLYLNQTAWNGLWRVNKRGRFNVPWGARPFRGMTGEEMSALAQFLSDVEIREADFRDVLAEPTRGDFVYLDPPYLPVSDTSKFFFYTEKRFRRPDLAELASICRELTDRGVHWVLSNRDTPEVRDLFAGARIIRLTTRRSVAAQNRMDIQPVDSPEVIIVNEGPGYNEA